MNFGGLFFLLITQFITGRGIMELCKLKLSRFILYPMSMILGIAVFSFLPFIMALLHIFISVSTVAMFLCGATLLACIPLLKYLKNFKVPSFGKFKIPNIYEYPFLIVFTLLMLLSMWRCYYYPTNPRDMLAGPEAIAEFAVREGTVINSIYNIDLQSTNNQLKPLYVTDLQIIYKMFVQPFGQVWLSVLVLSFIVMVITLLKEKLHPIIAGFVMVYFFGMPEVFGYTYLMLFDYSNMIFFFCGFYFLARYFTDKERGNFGLSVLLFSIATFVRPETLVLIGMTIPVVVYYMYKDKKPVTEILLKNAIYLIAPAIIYFLCISIFDKYYIPQHYNVSGDMNKNLGDIGRFFEVIGDIPNKLIFSPYGDLYYGYFINLFLLVFVVDMVMYVVSRKPWSPEKVIALYGIMTVWIGLAFLSYLFPLVDLLHTIKRGLFKMFPLMLLYYRNSNSLLWLTDIINKWEYNKPDNTPRSAPGVRQQPAPVKVQPAVKRR